MQEQTGRIYPLDELHEQLQREGSLMSRAELERRLLSGEVPRFVPIPDEDLERVEAMDPEQRRAWAKEQRAKLSEDKKRRRRQRRAQKAARRSGRS